MDKDTQQVFTLKQFRPSSIYRLLLIGAGISINLLCLIFGILGMFGFNTVSYNGAPVHGLMALPVGILLGLGFTLVFTSIFGTLCCLGLWIYSRLRPLTIRVLD